MLFIGVLVYVGAHKKVIDALDHRSARIKAELDEARRLRDEAASSWPTTSASSSEAEREAEAIIAGAKAEAERVAAEAKAKMEEFVARRTKLAESKIAQAEAQALADVRAAAAEAAVDRRRADPARHRQGRGRRQPDRPRHRGRESQAQLTALLHRPSRITARIQGSECSVAAQSRWRVHATVPFAVKNRCSKAARSAGASFMPATASIILPREST